MVTKKKNITDQDILAGLMASVPKLETLKWIIPTNGEDTRVHTVVLDLMGLIPGLEKYNWFSLETGTSNAVWGSTSFAHALAKVGLTLLELDIEGCADFGVSLEAVVKVQSGFRSSINID